MVGEMYQKGERRVMKAPRHQGGLINPLRPNSFKRRVKGQPNAVPLAVAYQMCVRDVRSGQRCKTGTRNTLAFMQ